MPVLELLLAFDTKTSMSLHLSIYHKRRAETNSKVHTPTDKRAKIVAITL